MKQSNTVLLSFFVILLSIGLCNLAIGQVFNARIVVQGVSAQMVTDLPSPKPFTTASTGLKNVGRGSNVWLVAKALYGTDAQHAHYDTITGLTWSVISAPAGSGATINPTDTATGLIGLTAMFVPDSLGQYQIGLTVTTSHGTTPQATIYVNAANYVGVGNIVGAAASPECATCHSDKETGWKNTGHSFIFSTGIDGILAGTHYGNNCIGCHTTGNDKVATAVNDGFDDRATAHGWVFPDTIKAGNWDSMKVNYPEVAKLANIQCESCHGPGSQHSGVKSESRIVADLDPGVCAYCHDAPTHHTKVLEWNQSVHANSLAEGDNIEYMNRTSCSRCHTGQGFIREVIDGQPSAAPYADVQPITCAACHDPHNNDHPPQLRRPSIAEACTGCHKTRVSSFSGLHHAHQGPMLAGVKGISYNGEAGPIGDWGGWQLAGYMYTNSSHSDIAEKCVQCHMAAPPADSTFGLPAGTLIKKLGGHTFNIMWDHDTPSDDLDDIVNPTGCRECHGEVSHEFVELSQNKIRTLLDSLGAILPHRTSGDTTAPKFHTDATLTKIQKVAAYNWYFVTNDNSFGVHNHDYAKALLRASIAQVKLGALAADIVSINDVPNDQGKQVQIIWNQFPGELASLNPVVAYGVWRKDPMTAEGKAGALVVKSLEDMYKKQSAGTRFVLGGDVWTYVGYVPAARQPQYSLVVPTLFDSTITSGMAWSTFYVSGHTDNANIIYSSMADSGYSIDNLAPAPPSGVAATVITDAVSLNWNPPQDGDFKYFAVYRGTSPNFVPGTPIATTSDDAVIDHAVVQGTTYYYKLSAYDFSGNMSNYSAEIQVLVLGVGEESGVPKEFALRQNYPNPFNPTTGIKYQVPISSRVRITVYNTLGVEIARLVNRDQEPGFYTLVWDGRDNAGKIVSSGIYLYKMEAGTYSSVKKMILMK